MANKPKTVREAINELLELQDGQALTSQKISELIGRSLIDARSTISTMAKEGNLVMDKSGGHTALYSLPVPGANTTPRDLLTRTWKPAQQFSEGVPA